MKTPILFKEYLWLINTIKQYGPISLSEINRRWVRTEMSDGLEIPRSTFNRHKDAIQDIFGVNIDCDVRNGYKYLISNAEVLDDDTIQNWVINTLSSSYALAENISLHKRILLEPTSGDANLLQLIMDAMKESRRIKINHQKYTSSEVRSYFIDPYCIKMCQGRWYLLAHFKRPAREGEKVLKRKGLPDGYVDFYTTFALDRILSAEILDESFIMDEGFDASEYFRDCFGIVHGDGTPCMKVVIRAYETEICYMADLPWHPSQKMVNEGEDFADFEFHIRPTLDFSTKIVSRGYMVKVLEPQWLADEIKMMHEDAFRQYVSE